MDAYTLLKWLHIVGGAVLFGTGLGTAFHFWRAHRSGEWKAIAVAARSVVLADFAFTLPAVVLQPATGLAMATLAGFPLGATWLAGAIALYAIAGACWIPVVFIQLRLRSLAEDDARGSKGEAAFERLARLWYLLGWPAFTSVAVIFWLMIAKPA